MLILGVSQVCFAEAPEVAQPVQQSEMMSTIVKFVTVMGAVMLSSLAIFIGLSVWNAILSRSRSKTIDYDVSLKEPHSVDEAIFLFIHKNKLK